MEKLESFDAEAFERAARRRSAWGLYGAHVRETTLKNDCSRLRENLRRDGIQKDDIEKRVEEFQRSSTDNFLRVG